MDSTELLLHFLEAHEDLLVYLGRLRKKQRALLVLPLPDDVRAMNLQEVRAQLLQAQRAIRETRVLLRQARWELAVAEASAEVADTPAVSERVRQAARTFSWLPTLAPGWVWQEETGDALEVISEMEKAGCSTFQIRLKVWSTIVWVLLNALREVVAGLTGRKSPRQ